MVSDFEEEYLNLLRKMKLCNDVTSRNGIMKEQLNVSICITDGSKVITHPEFKTNIEYAEEELRWYRAKTKAITFSPVIEKAWNKYSDDNINVNSNYGVRMFNGQWEWVKNKLQHEENTRQAIININCAEDKEVPTKDFPCCIAMQFILRDDKLSLSTMMRSQDIYLGMRNDVYCFMSFLEQMADELHVKRGYYFHYCVSLHIYEKHFSKLLKI